MEINKISGECLDAAIQVHKHFGPGLLESVYQGALLLELEQRGLRVESEVPINADYLGNELGLGFRADLIVEQAVLVELKSVERLEKVHGKQVLTYLKLTNLNLGLLINFGAPTLKEGFRRIANNLSDSASLREK